MDEPPATGIIRRRDADYSHPMAIDRGRIASCPGGAPNMRRYSRLDWEGPRADYPDRYWPHNFDPVTPVEETRHALDDLVSAGKIRYIGFSALPGWATAEAATIARPRGWTPIRRDNRNIPCWNELRKASCCLGLGTAAARDLLPRARRASVRPVRDQPRRIGRDPERSSARRTR